jgi:uncharacterized protein YggU (UPF0235/DUF167 family)
MAHLRVRLTPSGGADRIEGTGQDVNGERFLKARVRAAPEDGKANAALEALLAKTLRLPKTKIAVTRGQTARLKTLAIDGADEADIEALYAQFPELPNERE